tara:strand:+ start:2131 stop:2940 length:810 start_codon:yes stop_codon:yes gene_type:complete
VPDYLDKKDLDISNEFKKKGFIVKNIKNKKLLKKLENNLIEAIKSNLNFKKKISNKLVLNNIHKYLDEKRFNEFRLDIINKINLSKDFKKNFYLISKFLLETLVGNELVMQNKLNLSIQTPKDSSSLLPVHSDVWSGDSPFEIVVWLPFVDCYNTKSMYILPQSKYKKFEKNFQRLGKLNSEKVYQFIKKDVQWINIKYGQMMVFNQTLPHGNRINNEKTTRWSINCRFKSIFSPYGDKKLGEFFEPITLRVISDLGMQYKLPDIDEKN